MEVDWREVLSNNADYRYHLLNTEPKIVEYNYKDKLAETDKAWLIEMLGGEKHWLPKSRCWLDEKNKIIYLPFWLEQKKLFGDSWKDEN